MFPGLGPPDKINACYGNDGKKTGKNFNLKILTGRLVV